MRVLRIIASVDPAGGGPIEGVRLSATRQYSMGIETEVLYLDPPESPHVAAFPGKVHAIGHLTKRYGYTPKLSEWLTNHGREYDVAVVHGLWNHAVVAGGHSLIRIGLPYVVFAHGMMDPWFKRTYPRKHLAKQLFWWVFQGKVLNRAHRVLFTSKEEMAQSNGVFLGSHYRGQVVPYGAEVPDGRSKFSDVKAFRQHCSGVGNASFLLFLSRIHEKKGVDILIDAFARIAMMRPDLHLVIAGPDQVGLVEKLRERAKVRGVAERVHFPGMLTGPAKWGAYFSADAFVLPSHQENFGIAVAEALGCGLPVITTNKVNIWREIKASGAGFIGNDELEDFTRLLRQWIFSTENEKESTRASALSCYNKNFSAEAAADGLRVILADALER